MDTNDRDGLRDDADLANQAGDGTALAPASSPIIGTNITGLNTAPFPGGIVAPASELESANRADEESDAVNLEALEQFGSKHRNAGDQGVSAGQSEMEAGELNG